MPQKNRCVKHRFFYARKAGVSAQNIRPSVWCRKAHTCVPRGGLGNYGRVWENTSGRRSAPACNTLCNASLAALAATHNTAREPRRSATEPGGCGGSLYGAILRLGAFFIALFAVFVNKLYAFEEVFVGA